MNTYTLYDSAFMHKNPNLSPVHHLRCDLKMCEKSIKMLKDNGVVKDIKKFPTELHCVLTEIPEIRFSSDWQEGGTATSVFTPITQFLNDSTLGQAIQLVAGSNNIPIVPTNEYSQKVLKSTCRPELKLKFTIYTDTYNKRYNFTSSPYETWLRMMYFSTAPIYKASFANLYKMLTTAVDNIAKHSDDIVKAYDTVVDGGAALLNSLPFVEKDPSSSENFAKVAENIDELSNLVVQYLVEANKIGHVCWDVIIPDYLHATDKTSSPVFWNVHNFNVAFSDKFTRGLVNKNDVDMYRPRPLYANFDVTLVANQEMTRDQYIRLLFGNVYENLMSKNSTNSAS